MMKKHIARKFALSAIASALFTMPAVVAADDTECVGKPANEVCISQNPLLGASQIVPSIVLALSVEYPTAGIAYSTTNFLTADMLKEGTDASPHAPFLGYFDNNKCYEYALTKKDGNDVTNNSLSVGGYKDALHGSGARATQYQGTLTLGDGYFYPTSDAQTINGYQGLCSGSHEWSGNMLNFMSMSALDIVRQTLTGGNRAKGVGANSTVYSEGDPTTGDFKGAFLRRAMMWNGTQSSEVYPMVEDDNEQLATPVNKVRQFDDSIYNTTVNGKPLFDYLVPDGFSASMNDIKKCSFGSGSNQYSDPFGVTEKNKQDGSGSCSGVSRLTFWNSGTGFYAALYHSKKAANPGINGDWRVYQSAKDTAKIGENGTSSQARWFNVVVKTPEKPTGILQDKADMRTAAMGYLPEKRNNDDKGGDGGVLRASMRKVMDSEVRSDGSFFPNPDNKTNPDADGNSGVINYVNKFGDNAPYDSRDAVAELYYTAIRYLRNGSWKWVDGDGLNKTGQERQGTAGALPYSLDKYKNATSDEKTRLEDGFPVIQTWDDPLKAAGDKDKDMQCYAPAIIVLGDTNTHADNNLPNYPTASGITDNVALYPDGKKPEGNTNQHYYEEVCKLSGFCSSNSDWRVSSGSNGGGTDDAPTFGMAGMAYWVKTNNVRPDIVRDDKQETHIDSFFIDVLEAGMLKTKGNLYSATKATSDAQMQNSYYLAGKFASPDYEKGKTYTYDEHFKSTNADRSLWTSDKWDDEKENKGSSNASFPLGMPYNYAVANNPAGLRSSLIQAFKTVGFVKNTMQSAIQYNNNGNATLNVTGANGSATLVGDGKSENKDKPIKEVKSGDKVVGYQINNRTELEEMAQDGTLPLSLRAGYQFSKRTGFLQASILLPGRTNSQGTLTSLTDVPFWEAGGKLFNMYHGDTYTSRASHVETRTGAAGSTSTFKRFTPDTTPDTTNYADIGTWINHAVIEDPSTNYFNKLPSGITTDDLIKYILGDSSKEGDGGLRLRKESLLGTSVYSSVTPILKNKETDYVRTVPIGDANEKTCKYKNFRSQDYAAMSSNEGMLHIFDMATGTEKYAYMPQTALPYIANYANPDYEIKDHRYVNDGKSLIHEVCDKDTKEAKTYLVGTSGRGASSIYAIDVTTDSNFHAVREINANDDADIGILVSGPMVINDQNNNSILVFSSGYNAKGSTNGYLFFYDLKTGTQLSKVQLGKVGVGAPVGYDENNDGVVDRIYVGDQEGHIWRVNSKDGKGTWDYGESTTAGKKLFECTTDCQPITSRPIVGKVNNQKTVVLVGTGEYFSFNDLTNATQNYAYGIFDEKGDVTNVDSSKLLTQNFTKKNSKVSDDDSRLTYLEISHNKAGDEGQPAEADVQGWKLVLPQGYVITSDAGFYGPQNQIATYTATRIQEEGNRSCNVNGSTLFIAVDAQNGGAYNQALFDTNGDGNFNNDDLVSGYSHGAVEIANMIAPNGGMAHTNDKTYVEYDDNPNPDPDCTGSDCETNKASVNVRRWIANGTVRRVSWREIF